jgi:PAS domain S-box-containing protein
MPEINRSDEQIQAALHNITEQLEILKAAQKGYEEIFLSTNENRSDIVLLANKQFIVVFASPSCLPILGYTPEEILGQSCLDIVHPDDWSPAVETFFEIANSGASNNRIEFRLLHKNGFYVNIEAIGKFMENFLDSGGIILHYRDITKQKQSEQIIFEQKQFYEIILNSIYDGVCVTDKHDIITFINKGFSTTMGMPAGEIIGKKIPPDILAARNQFFQYHYFSARNSLQPVSFESILVTTSSGISKYLSGWCMPRQLAGQFDSMICTFTDITEQQHIKEKLSESEIRFRSIAETATDGIITVNVSGEVIFWNTAASVIFGYTEAEIMGKDIYQIMSEEIISEHTQIFAEPEESMIHRSIGKTVEGKARRKDGKNFPIELSIASWMNGGEVYFTAIIRDITHRKHIEKSLQHSEQELKNLSSRLLNAHEQERKRIAYELHDGLGQILSAAKIGVKTLLGGGDQSHDGGIYNSPDNLLNIIQSAIDEVRRISRNLRPSILDDLGIVAAINSLCLDFEMFNSQISVTRDIVANDEDIPEQIRIVLYRVTQEACNNIVRHSHADMVSVRLSSAAGAIQLSIYDDGIGFDVKSLHKGRWASRGLGLSSMRERVEFSGGVFTLTSSPGRGTTVHALWQ